MSRSSFPPYPLYDKDVSRRFVSLQSRCCFLGRRAVGFSALSGIAHGRPSVYYMRISEQKQAVPKGLRQKILNENKVGYGSVLEHSYNVGKQ